MSAAPSSTGHTEIAARPGEQNFVLSNVSWRDYCVLRDLLDGPGIRMAFLNGVLELMSPSRVHEGYEVRIARLVELFAVERDVPLYGYGSTTFRNEAVQRGMEPDACYCHGADLRDVPDIAIEVVLTSGIVDKLSVYRGLGIREVWLWKDDAFQLFALKDGAYVPVERSGLVPGLNFVVLAEFARRTDQPAAMREYRDRVRATP